MVNPVRKLLDLQQTILNRIEELKLIMSTTNTNASLGFADVQQAITQLVNDNTASNNAIAAQIQEVQGLILDFNNKSQSGNAPSQADYQGVISQLAAIHSLVQQNTASVQATTTAIQQADPNALTSGSSAGTGTGSGSAGSQSGASGAGSSSTSGSGAPTGTGTSPSGGSTISQGTPNPTPAGGATVEENSSSGVGSSPSSLP